MNGNATAASKVVKDNLGKYSDIKEKLVLQAYDSASVMSGHIDGVRALVRQDDIFATLFNLQLID